MGKGQDRGRSDNTKDDDAGASDQDPVSKGATRGKALSARAARRSNTLKYGDVISLSSMVGGGDANGSYLYSDVDATNRLFVHSLKDKYPMPPRWTMCLFEVLPKLSYSRKDLSAGDEGHQMMSEEDGSAGRTASLAFHNGTGTATMTMDNRSVTMVLDDDEHQEFWKLEEQRKHNTMEIKNMRGEEVRFGSVIQLRHVVTGRFLSFEGSPTALNVSNTLVETSEGHEGAWLKLMPAFRIRSEGEPVSQDDSVLLQSVSVVLQYLHVAGEDGMECHIPVGAHPEHVSTVHEVHGSTSASAWKVIIAGNLKDDTFTESSSSFRRSLIRPLSSVLLCHQESNTMVYSRENEPTGLLEPHEAMNHVKNPPPLALWDVEPLEMKNSCSVVRFGERYRLRHALTGRYLTVASTSKDRLGCDIILSDKQTSTKTQKVLFTFVSSKAGSENEPVALGSSVYIQDEEGRWLASKNLALGSFQDVVSGQRVAGLVLKEARGEIDAFRISKVSDRHLKSVRYALHHCDVLKQYVMYTKAARSYVASKKPAADLVLATEITNAILDIPTLALKDPAVEGKQVSVKKMKKKHMQIDPNPPSDAFLLSILASRWYMVLYKVFSNLISRVCLSEDTNAFTRSGKVLRDFQIILLDVGMVATLRGILECVDVKAIRRTDYVAMNRISQLCYRLLTLTARDNLPIKRIMSADLPFYRSHVGTKILCTDVITELLMNNMGMLNQLTDRDMLDQIKTIQKEKDKRFLSFLTASMSCNGIHHAANRSRVLRLILSDKKQKGGTDATLDAVFLSEELLYQGDVVVDIIVTDKVSGETLKLAQYKETADSVMRVDSDSCSGSEQLLQYYVALVDMLVTLCEGRNFDAQLALFERCPMEVSLVSLLGKAESPHLPQIVRSTALQLLAVIYLETLQVDGPFVDTLLLWPDAMQHTKYAPSNQHQHQPQGRTSIPESDGGTPSKSKFIRRASRYSVVLEQQVDKSRVRSFCHDYMKALALESGMSEGQAAMIVAVCRVLNAIITKDKKIADAESNARVYNKWLQMGIIELVCELMSIASTSCSDRSHPARDAVAKATNELCGLLTLLIQVRQNIGMAAVYDEFIKLHDDHQRKFKEVYKHVNSNPRQFVSRREQIIQEVSGAKPERVYNFITAAHSAMVWGQDNILHLRKRVWKSGGLSQNLLANEGIIGALFKAFALDSSSSLSAHVLKLIYVVKLEKIQLLMLLYPTQILVLPHIIDCYLSVRNVVKELTWMVMNVGQSKEIMGDLETNIDSLTSVFGANSRGGARFHDVLRSIGGHLPILQLISLLAPQLFGDAQAAPSEHQLLDKSVADRKDIRRILVMCYAFVGEFCDKNAVNQGLLANQIDTLLPPSFQTQDAQGEIVFRALVRALMRVYEGNPALAQHSPEAVVRAVSWLSLGTTRQSLYLSFLELLMIPARDTCIKEKQDQVMRFLSEDFQHVFTWSKGSTSKPLPEAPYFSIRPGAMSESMSYHISTVSLLAAASENHPLNRMTSRHFLPFDVISKSILGLIGSDFNLRRKRSSGLSLAAKVMTTAKRLRLEEMLEEDAGPPSVSLQESKVKAQSPTPRDSRNNKILSKLTKGNATSATETSPYNPSHLRRAQTKRGSMWQAMGEDMADKTLDEGSFNFLGCLRAYLRALKNLYVTAAEELSSSELDYLMDPILWYGDNRGVRGLLELFCVLVNTVVGDSSDSTAFGQVVNHFSISRQRRIDILLDDLAPVVCMFYELVQSGQFGWHGDGQPSPPDGMLISINAPSLAGWKTAEFRPLRARMDVQVGRAVILLSRITATNLVKNTAMHRQTISQLASVLHESNALPFLGTDDGMTLVQKLQKSGGTEVGIHVVIRSLWQHWLDDYSEALDISRDRLVGIGFMAIARFIGKDSNQHVLSRMITLITNNHSKFTSMDLVISLRILHIFVYAPSDPKSTEDQVKRAFGAYMAHESPITPLSAVHRAQSILVNTGIMRMISSLVSIGHSEVTRHCLKLLITLADNWDPRTALKLSSDLENPENEAFFAYVDGTLRHAREGYETLWGSIESRSSTPDLLVETFEPLFVKNADTTNMLKMLTVICQGHDVGIPDVLRLEGGGRDLIQASVDFAVAAISPLCYMISEADSRLGLDRLVVAIFKLLEAVMNFHNDANRALIVKSPLFRVMSGVFDHLSHNSGSLLKTQKLSVKLAFISMLNEVLTNLRDANLVHKVTVEVSWHRILADAEDMSTILKRVGHQIHPPPGEMNAKKAKEMLGSTLQEMTMLLLRVGVVERVAHSMAPEPNDPTADIAQAHEICPVKGCGRKKRCRGYCLDHGVTYSSSSALSAVLDTFISVELVSSTGSINRVFFRLPASLRAITSDKPYRQKCLDYLYQVPRDNPKEKAAAYVMRMVHVAHQSIHRREVLKVWWKRLLIKFSSVIFVMPFVIAVIMSFISVLFYEGWETDPITLFGSDSEYSNQVAFYASFGLGVVQLAFSFLMLVSFTMIDLPVKIAVKQYLHGNVKKTLSPWPRKGGDERRFGAYWAFFVDRVADTAVRLNVIIDPLTFYFCIHVVCSLCALLLSPYFYIYHLLDMYRFKTVQETLGSITVNFKKLVEISFLGLLCLYAFTVLALAVMPKLLQTECTTVYMCFVQILTTWDDPSLIYNRPTYQAHFWEDGRDFGWAAYYFSYTMFASVFFTGGKSSKTAYPQVLTHGRVVIQGIIFDTFGQIRDDNTRAKDDLNTKCFVCSLTRFELDQRGTQFSDHVEFEHHPWSYVQFVMYIFTKDPQTDTSLEREVRNALDSGSLSFIPVMRALCLPFD